MLHQSSVEIQSIIQQCITANACLLVYGLLWVGDLIRYVMGLKSNGQANLANL